MNPSNSVNQTIGSLSVQGTVLWSLRGAAQCYVHEDLIGYGPARSIRRQGAVSTIGESLESDWYLSV
jgi:hypothetical protein